MGSSAPDPEQVPHPAERFQRGWSRIFLWGILGGFAFGVVFSTVTAEEDALRAVSTLQLIGWAPLFASIGGAIALPAVWFLTLRIFGPKEAVTGRLRGTGAAHAVLLGLASPLVFEAVGEWAGWGVLTVAGATLVAAGVTRPAASGSSVAAGSPTPPEVWYGLVALLMLWVMGVSMSYFVRDRAGAYYAVMRSDLRNLQARQELYWSEHRTYSVDPTVDGELAYSRGVTVEVHRADSATWRARLGHEALPGTTCELRGSEPSQRSGAGSARPVCQPEAPAPSMERFVFWLAASIPAMIVVLGGVGGWRLSRRTPLSPPDRPRSVP